jgi:hypothetical protein
MTRLEIKVGKKTESYHLPVSWDEVNIKQYQDVMILVEDDKLSDISLMVKTIAALTGVEERQLIKAPVSHLREVYATLGLLTANMPNKDLTRVVEIEGVEYGFIPDMKNLTFGEFVDLDTWLQEGYKNLVEILTILYRPVVKRLEGRYIIEEYDIDSASTRAKLFSKSLSIDTAYGALVFFYDIGNKHRETMLCYLEKQQKKRSSMVQIERS